MLSTPKAIRDTLERIRVLAITPRSLIAMSCMLYPGAMDSPRTIAIRNCMAPTPSRRPPTTPFCTRMRERNGQVEDAVP